MDWVSEPKGHPEERGNGSNQKQTEKRIVDETSGLFVEIEIAIETQIESEIAETQSQKRDQSQIETESFRLEIEKLQRVALEQRLEWRQQSR